MDPALTSALISAGSSLLGGAIGGGQKRPRYEPYIRALVGPGMYSRPGGWSLSDAEAYHQGNMIKADWDAKMASAKKWGIHPNVILGTGTSNFGSPGQAYIPESSGRGSAIAQAGQDIGRAFHAYSTKEERALAATQAQLALENQGLQNELLRTQIRNLSGAGMPPGIAGSTSLPSQGNAVEVVPTTVHPKSGHAQLGSDRKAFYQVVKGPGGNMVMASDDMLQALEQDPLLIPQWYANMILGSVVQAGRDTGRWLSSRINYRNYYKKGGK